MLWSDTSPKPHLIRRLCAVFSIVTICVAAAVAISPSATASGAYQITLVGPSQSPMAGVPFVLKGTVSPAAVGSKVRLQRYYGGKFHTVANGQLDAGSAYEFAQVFDTAGGRTFRVTKRADHSIGRGISPLRRFFVTGNSLHSAVILRSGNSLISSRGTYTLTMLATVDLVISIASTGRVIWSFGTAGHPGATAVLQRDGNLVVHASDGSVLKTTGSGGHPAGTYTMTIQEDSNLVIYTPGGTALWSSNTTNNLLGSTESLHAGQFLRSHGRQYQLIMQKDGNLVLYDTTNGSVTWETNTSVMNSRVIMGPGGALTIYGPLGKELWSTHTSGYPGATATLQTDGNLVVYHKGVAIWASRGIGGVLGDDYPENLRNAERDSIIDPWRFYNRECTSFVAWRMNSANHVTFNNFMGGGRFGSAYNWDDNARALGYRVDHVPARGAIAQSDRLSHVAWVAAVGDGVVTIEDYNYTRPGEYDVRTVPTSSYIYIHIKDL